jgi:thiol:disulfide interchange protein
VKNWIIILLIFAIPLGMYGFLEKAHGERLFQMPKKQGAMVYKFYSPMCADCKIVQKDMVSIKAKYPALVIEEVEVTQQTKGTKDLIKKYNITTVPTLIFIDKDGNTTDRLESEIGKDDIEKCVKKILSDEVKQ